MSRSEDCAFIRHWFAVRMWQYLKYSRLWIGNTRFKGRKSVQAVDPRLGGDLLPRTKVIHNADCIHEDTGW